MKVAKSAAAASPSRARAKLGPFFDRLVEMRNSELHVPKVATRQGQGTGYSNPKDRTVLRAGFDQILALKRLAHLDFAPLIKFMERASRIDLAEELTPASVRGDMQRLLSIEQKLIKASGEDDVESIHAACGHAGATFYSNVLESFGASWRLGDGRITLGGVAYNLSHHQLCALMWHCAVAARYTYSGCATAMNVPAVRPHPPSAALPPQARVR